MKKRLSVLLSLVIVIAMLVGCGSKTNTKEKTTEDDAVEDTGKLESGDVVLTVWSGNEDEALIKAIADKFIAEHKNDANITIKWVGVSEGECRTTLLSDILNGADVYTTTDGEARMLASGGGAAVIPDVDEIKKTTLVSAVDAVTVNGKVYGYPVTADNGYFLYYNKKYFSESDVTTLDKLLETAAKNNKKFAMDWSSGYYLYSFFGLTGLTVGLNDDGITNNCDWNSTDKEINGTDVVQSLMNIAASEGFASMNQEEWIAGAQSGDVAAIVSGVWDADAIKAAWGDDFAATILPTYTCAGKQIQMACFFGYKFVGVNPYSKHYGWAQEFAKYVSNATNQKLRFQMRSQIPANNEAAADPEVKQSIAGQAVLAQSQYSTLQRVGGNYWGAMTDLGTTVLNGNPQNLTLQEIIDATVASITKATV